MPENGTDAEPENENPLAPKAFAFGASECRYLDDNL